MRIAIQGIDGAQPVVLEGMKAVILAADDGGADGTCPCVAHGDPLMLARLAALVLVSIRDRLGEKTFESVVSAARKAQIDVEDITDRVRQKSPSPTSGTTEADITQANKELP